MATPPGSSGSCETNGPDGHRGELPPRGRALVDSAPIIYFLGGHREPAPRSAPFFERAVSRTGRVFIHASAVKAAERLDGKFVVHSDDDTLSAA